MSGIGRNSPCPCGSGRKYKKCCLPKVGHGGFPSRISVGGSPERAEEESPSSETDERQDEYGSDEEAQGCDDVEVEDQESAAPFECPQIDQELPPAGNAEEAVVDAWWRDFKPFYVGRDTEQMLRRIHGFLDGHPDPFIHLRLDEECLFELGAALARRGERSRYVELLLRIRREQPRSYLLAHGYHDRDVIADSLLAGRRSEVVQFFDLFKAYPDSSPDQLNDVVNILLSANCDTELLDLVRAVAVPVARSRRVIGGEFALVWLIFEQLLPALDARDASEGSIQGVLERLDALDLPIRLDRKSIATDIQETLGGLPDPSSADLRGRDARERYQTRVMRHFTCWVHDQQGLSWVSARHFGIAVAKALADPSQEKGALRRFHLDEATLEGHIVQTCKR
ncbi:MAG: SEC-C domain-containing protein, partial [Planctomycetota bacterium]